MLRLLSSIALAAAAQALAVGPAQAAIGPDAARCRNGANEPAFLVNVSGFKSRRGQVRVQIYGSNPSDFLTKGKRVRRVDLPVSSSGTMPVCVALPRPGTYAVAVRHDADGNGKSGWNDGGGFSRNPKISLINLKPKHRDVAVVAGRGVTQVNVVLNYRKGLVIGPIQALR